MLISSPSDLCKIKLSLTAKVFRLPTIRECVWYWVVCQNGTADILSVPNKKLYFSEWWWMRDRCVIVLASTRKSACKKIGYNWGERPTLWIAVLPLCFQSLRLVSVCFVFKMVFQENLGFPGSYQRPAGARHSSGQVPGSSGTKVTKPLSVWESRGR